MKIAKSMGVQIIVVTIILELTFVNAQWFYGNKQNNIQPYEDPRQYNNAVPNVVNINSELENIFRNKNLNDGTRKYESKRNRNKPISQTNSFKAKEDLRHPTEDTVPFCSMDANFSKFPFPFCWNEMNSSLKQMRKSKSETQSKPIYIWNFNNINYNFYFPFNNLDDNRLQKGTKIISSIDNSRTEKKELLNRLFLNPSENITSLNFTNVNNELSSKPLLSNTSWKSNIENLNVTYKINDPISFQDKMDKKVISELELKQINPTTGNNKDLNDPNNETQQNDTSTILTNPSEFKKLLRATSSIEGNEDMEEELLRDIKASITQMHSRYFPVVSRQLSQKSKTSLGRDTLSFIISPLWLVLTMIQLSTGAHGSTLQEIERVTQFHHSKEHKLQAVRLLIDKFPMQTKEIRLSGYTRLTVDSQLNLSNEFQKQAYSSMGMNVSSLNMKDIGIVTKQLNQQIQNDTNNCIRRSFDVADLEFERPRVALWNAAYLRAAWRSAPTVLNGSSTVYLVNGSTAQLRMFRLNDVMRIATVNEWNATVLEIPYKTSRLRQVIVMPHYPNNLLKMESQMTQKKDLLGYLEPLFKEFRIEANLPKYTLEMTLLLPSKLKEMGMGSSVSPKANFGGIWSGTGGYITHAVQHVKFWAEEGRGAFKDDGLVWDPVPDLKVTLNNPYFFLIRLDDMILMSGHFAI